MARVRIRRDDLSAGRLPPVCAVTGRPTRHSARVRFDSLPDWSWVLLLFGVLPFLVAAAFAPERVEARVHVERHIVARYQRRRWSSLALALGGAFLVASGAFYDVQWWVVAGWIGVALGVVLGVAALRGFVGGTLEPAGGWVRLTRVHPNFVDALQRSAQGPAHSGAQ